MITRNGNLFITENALGIAQEAMQIVRGQACGDVHPRGRMAM